MSGPIALKVVHHFRKMGPSPNSPKEGENLTARERLVLDLLAQGFIYKEIAAKLTIGTETVRYYIKRICLKLRVRNRIEAVAKHRAES